MGNRGITSTSTAFSTMIDSGFPEAHPCRPGLMLMMMMREREFLTFA